MTAWRAPPGKIVISLSDDSDDDGLGERAGSIAPLAARAPSPQAVGGSAGRLAPTAAVREDNVSVTDPEVQRIMQQWRMCVAERLIASYPLIRAPAHPFACPYVAVRPAQASPGIAGGGHRLAIDGHRPLSGPG